MGRKKGPNSTRDTARSFPSRRILCFPSIEILDEGTGEVFSNSHSRRTRGCSASPLGDKKSSRRFTGSFEGFLGEGPQAMQRRIPAEGGPGKHIKQREARYLGLELSLRRTKSGQS